MTHTPHLYLLEHHPQPVLSTDTMGAESNKYGFEGGRVSKIGQTYHLFTTEMSGDPRWVKTRLAHWTSQDRLQWQRASTLAESSGDFTGSDPRGSLWAPMPIYDHGYWHLFYIAYRCAPGEGMVNYEGRVWHALSTVPGIEGIDGPYQDRGVIFEPGPASEPWEGLQGTDSFFPYQVGEHWYAIYGSATTEIHRPSTWLVGLCEAPTLVGPWQRCPTLNPLPIEKRFIENPIVTQLHDGTFIAVYDTGINYQYGLGYATSPDGITWQRAEPIIIPGDEQGGWVKLARTPLGLIQESENTCTLFYSGLHDFQSEEAPFDDFFSGRGSIGLVTLQI